MRRRGDTGSGTGSVWAVTTEQLGRRGNRFGRMSLHPPDALRASYADWEWIVAYEWPEKATTWRLDGGSAHDDLFVKVVISRHYPTPLEEAERMRWARPYLPVPDVIDCGSDDDVDWLVTAALAGTD